MDTYDSPTNEWPKTAHPALPADVPRHVFISDGAPEPHPRAARRRVSRLAGLAGVAVLSAAVASASTVGVLTAFGFPTAPAPAPTHAR